ncbi:MAG: hypothetical protein ABSE73_08885 [Planctomycetota bacterium]
MFRLRALVLVLALGLLPWGACADDGNRPEVKTAEKSDKEQKTKEEKKEEKKAEQRGGNCITRFWVHTVGGTIGGGLKTGAHKISGAFD